jgi:SAM-dependent methyltransferase
VFIIKGEQLNNAHTLRKLSELISSQSGYMDVKAVHEKRIATDDMKDFGIAISREKDVLVYELNIVGGSLYGGRISFQPERVFEAIDRYVRVSARATSIPRDSTYANVVDILDEITKASNTAITQEIIEQAKPESHVHNCLSCFLSTDVVMGLISEQDWDRFPEQPRNLCKRVAAQGRHKDWRDFPDHKRYWFDMMDSENKMVLDFVTQHKPKRIMEVGCGPGRLVSRILSIENYEYEEIVGIDGDEQMVNIALARFSPTKYPKVNVFHMRVKNKLPYLDDSFHFCINAMNIVGWQKPKDLEWLKEMMRCSYTTFFTLYKKGYEQERLAMYQTRPHRRDGVKIDEATGQIQIVDCATNPGVYSWAYTQDEVEILCEGVASAYQPKYEVNYSIESNANKLLYLCVISKYKKETGYENHGVDAIDSGESVPYIKKNSRDTNG